MPDNTKRFSQRVDNYTRYRPSYPKALLAYCSDRFKLGPEASVADIGSGTGIFTGLLLAKVKTVYAVEPNTEMRQEAERRLKSWSSFISINGCAEATTLAAHSVDFITAAQAFHWFNCDEAKKEFRRIIRPAGVVLLIKNERLLDTDFLVQYENIVSTSIPEYKLVNHNNITLDKIKAFLTHDFEMAEFGNHQDFAWEGLLGRLNSSSYMPLPGTEDYKMVTDKLRAAFERYAVAGRVQFNYKALVFAGRLGVAG